MKNSMELWLAAVREMTLTSELAASYLEDRLKFRNKVARVLTEGLKDQHVLYGVWLENHDVPIYIGQTQQAPRRLWDLPIGESHHLSNSFPPEIWSRVIVIYWMKFLQSSELRALMKVLGTNGADPLEAMGLGLEYLLQKKYSPMFNMRKKKRDGTLRPINWEKSRSLGARTSPHLTKVFPQILDAWEQLSTIAPYECQGHPISEYGRAVFPASLL